MNYWLEFQLELNEFMFVMKVNSIAAVIITLNEEQNISACIQSVLPIAQEVLVIDSFSTDSTKQIAESLGATVHQCEWLGYAATKNLAVDLVSSSHILSLDADEQLTPEAVYFIQSEIKSGLKCAYQFNRKNHYCGTWVKYAGWYPDAKVRLFDKHKARWVGEQVHETLQLDEGCTVVNTNTNILHFTYQSSQQQQATILKYARLGSKKLQQKSKGYLLAKLIFSPAVRFVKSYIFQLGFLSGKAGLHICTGAFKESWLKYYWALNPKAIRL